MCDFVKDVDTILKHVEDDIKCLDEKTKKLNEQLKSRKDELIKVKNDLQREQRREKELIIIKNKDACKEKNGLVYVVEIYDYEHNTLCGIYNKKENADLMMAKLKKENTTLSYKRHFGCSEYVLNYDIPY